MNVSVVNCSHCGGPLPVVPGQCICRCAYCRNTYYLDLDQPPAVVLADELDAGEARDMVLKALRDPRIEPGFRVRTYFERATLFYIPFSEVRGVKAGWAPDESEKALGESYSLVSFEYLEPANDLSAISLEVLDRNLVESAILKARQIPFHPVDMRRKGVVLPASPPRFSRGDSGAPDIRETVETHLRIIYFPVWEIAYSYRGMVFYSYCSAVDGSLILVNGLRNHRRKLALSLLGAFSLALLLGRSIRMAINLITGFSLNPISLFTALGLVAGAGLAWSVLFPYLWRLFAFREEISFSGEFETTRTISYREGRLVKFSRRFVRRITGEPDEEAPR